MIRIRVERNAHGDAERVLVTGHANFAEHGMDIVCAAVSGITIGQVNAMEQLLGVQAHSDDDGEGKVDLRVPEGLAPEVKEKMYLLVEAMVLSLRMIADEFPKNVKFISN